MTAIRSACSLPGVLLVLFTVGASVTAGQQYPAPQLPERYTAFAVNLGNIGTSSPMPLDITVTRWTTPAERELLLTALREKGQDALRDAMQKMPSVGTISTPGSLAYDFRYASQEITKQGVRRIVLLTDRPIEAGEAMTRPRSIDYPFGSIELLVDVNGRGKGTFSIATKLAMLDDLLILEGLADRPVDLNDVRRRK